MSQPLYGNLIQRVLQPATCGSLCSPQTKKHHLELQNYADLHDWSVTCPEIFWSDWWDYAGIIAHGKGDTILENGHLMPGARWFPNSHLNYAENLLQYRDQHTALVFCGEDGGTQ